jgi:hypothetical protein
MKKSLVFGLIFFTLTVLIHGSALAQAGPSGHVEGVQAPAVTAPVPPTGETMRYVVPYFLSVTGTGSRSATAIAVNNNTTKDCTISVQFQQAFLTAVACALTLTVPAGQGTYFCSRGLPGTTVDCVATCAPALTFDAGRVYISSNKACSNISVDGQILYTSDGADTLITGVRQLGLVKFNKGNTGD